MHLRHRTQAQSVEPKDLHRPLMKYRREKSEQPSKEPRTAFSFSSSSFLHIQLGNLRKYPDLKKHSADNTALPILGFMPSTPQKNGIFLKNPIFSKAPDAKLAKQYLLCI